LHIVVTLNICAILAFALFAQSLLSARTVDANAAARLRRKFIISAIRLGASSMYQRICWSYAIHVTAKSKANGREYIKDK
jgi:uncharacterized protein YlxP (DUF503 family)